MANICVTNLAVVGLQDPEAFAEPLARAMFDLDPERWGAWRYAGGKLARTDRLTGSRDKGDGIWEDYEEDVVEEFQGETRGCRDGQMYFIESENRFTQEGKKFVQGKIVEEVSAETCYQKLIARHKQERWYYMPLPVLNKPFKLVDVEVPRFVVESRWKPPFDEIKKASIAFPDLVFHASHFLEQDGPTGEFVMYRGKVLEDIESSASWYLFDEIKYPSMSLLPKYISLTLAQRGAAAVYDAIERIKMLHHIIHAPVFVESRYSRFRDQRKTEQTRETLDALLAHMEESGKLLTFDGVFLPDMTNSETYWTPDELFGDEKVALERMNVEDVQP